MLFERGNSKYDLKEFRDALSDVNKAIELNPNEAFYYRLRIDIKNHLHDF